MFIFNKASFTKKESFDNTNKRIFIATSLSFFRLAFASVLLFIFGPELFKDIFSDISILSLTALALFGLPISVKEELLKNSYGKSTTSFYYGLFKILIISVMLIFIIISSLNAIAIIMFGLRFYFLLIETQQEINGERYALINQLYAEFIIAFITLLFFFNIEIITLTLILFALYEFLQLIYINAKKDVTHINLSSLFQLKAWLLEISSVLIFGLNIFWASHFLGDTYFAIYFFSYRVASNLTIIWGVATKNIWAQLYKSDTGDSEKYLKNSEKISLKIILAGIALLITILIMLQFDIIFITSGNQFLSYFIISLCIYCIVYLVLQIQNRNIKNRITAKGQVYELYKSNFFVGIMLTTLLYICLELKFAQDYVFLLYFSVNIICLILLNNLQRKLVN